MSQAVRTSFFVLAFLLSKSTILFFPSSSASLSYFSLALQMRECLGEHSRTSSPFPVALLNGAFFRDST